MIISPDSTFYKLHRDIQLLCQGFIVTDALTNDFPEDTPEGLQINTISVFDLTILCLTRS